MAAILSPPQYVKHVFIFIEGQLYINGFVQERCNSIANALENSPETGTTHIYLSLSKLQMSSAKVA